MMSNLKTNLINPYRTRTAVMNLCGRSLRKFVIAPPSAFRALLICMLLCCLQTAMADNHDVGMLSYQLSTTDKTATVVGFTSSLTEGTTLEVPQTIDVDGTTYTVTALADNCLNVTDNKCPLLASVTLPTTVKNIGKYAFRGQSKLTSVSFPDVDVIHTGAFYGCTSLTEALLGMTTTVIEKEGDNYLSVFSGDVPLTKLTLSRAKMDKASDGEASTVGIFIDFEVLKQLKELHLPEFTHLNFEKNFYGAKALEVFDAPKLENVKTQSFDGCTSLKQLFLPSVKTIEEAAFNGLTSLVYLECPNCTTVGENIMGTSDSPVETLKFQSLENVADEAFQKCKKATTLCFPKAKTIGRYNFEDFSSLTTVYMPEVETVKNYAFQSCTALETVNMPKVTELGQAFQSCTQLKNVSMPKLTKMDGLAFMGCTSLAELHLPQLTTLTNYSVTAPALKVLDCPELTTRYRYLLQESRGTIEEVNVPKLDSLKDREFYGCQKLIKVNVEGAKTVGEYAFEGCTSLKTLSLPNVTTIGTTAFEGCTSLKTLSLPNVTTIGAYAFENCTSLKTLSLPNVTKTIGAFAFQNCTSLESLDLPSVSSIDGGAITGCTALKYLHLGPDIKDVSQGTIYISNTQLDHILHIWFDYKDGVIKAPAYGYMDAQKNSVVYHVDYSLLHNYMNDATWKNYIFERTLDDASEIQFTNGRYYFSLKRALKPTEWSTLVLPFSLTADQVKATFGQNVKLAEYTGSTHSAVSADGFDLNFQKTETITAGKPVLICGADEKADNTYLASTLVLGTETDRGKAVESGISQTDPSTDSNNHFNLQGTYTHNASFIQAGDYYLGSGNVLRHAKSQKALSSARMVIRYAGTNTQAKLMGMSFDGVTTGIDEVRLDSDTLAALQGNSSAQAPAYNLAGQRVDNGYKGIVIVNGKKLLRK